MNRSGLLLVYVASLSNASLCLMYPPYSIVVIALSIAIDPRCVISFEFFPRPPPFHACPFCGGSLDSATALKYLSINIERNPEQ